MSMYSSIDDFTTKLRSKNIPFAIIGGLAVFAYGGERATFDVDFLIDGSHVSAVKNIASQLGLKIMNENEYVLQLSGAIQIDIIFAKKKHSQKMLQNCKIIENLPYPVVAPEDLIGLKIQAFSSDRSREVIDKGDILTLMREVRNLDFQKIKEYADIFGVWSEILELKKHV